VTEDGVLVESIAILVYLARKYPHSNLLPDVNSWKYVEALSLLAWCTSALHPLVTRLRLPTRFCDLPGADARVRDLAREEMVTQLRIAEQSLLNRPWMLGDTWSIVDGYLLWIWARCPESGIEAGMFPNLVSHETRSMARSAVQRAIKREIKP
jgi:glutathione S-transferase